jgi:AraC-like DNA-binding protein
VNRTREATISLRWLVPFMRVTGQTGEDLDLLAREGLSLRELADPEARICHRAALELIAAAVERMCSPDLGLRAGEQLAPADFDSLELAVRTCANLRAGLELFGRYTPLLHGALAPHLTEQGELALWELRATDDVLPLVASNDFALSALFALFRRYLVRPCTLREVHLRHASASHLAAYARAFPGATLRFGRRHNALVFQRASLDTPMALAHPGLCALFEAQVHQRIERIHSARAMSLRVRHVLEEQLRFGNAGIASVAPKLGLNVSALRRGLANEGTTYRRLREQLRAELAERYLGDKALTVSEVAFLLGFATVAAFSKAFRRGHAVPPSAYRANLRRSMTPQRAAI